MSSVKRTSQNEPLDDEDNARAQTQPANRRLDFGATNRNRKSISVVDVQSPFVPKKTLRRSTGPGRPNPFDLPNDDGPSTHSSIRHTQAVPEESSDEDVEQSIEGHNGPIFYDDGESYPAELEQTAIEHDETGVPGTSDSPMSRKRGRPRKSDQSLDSSQIQTSSKKRGRASLEQTETMEESGASSKKKRASDGHNVTSHLDERTEIPSFEGVQYDDDGNDVEVYDGDVQQDSAIDAQAQLDSQLAAEEAGPSSKGRKGRPKKDKTAARKQRTNNPPPRQNGSPVKLNDSPSKRQRGGSAGPVSNVNLRATTPFEDAGQQTSRFGRNLIQPLKYWENEAVIWKEGEIEGIVRAESVDLTKPKKSKRKKSRRTARNQLDDIEEESDTESIMPDEWEATLGVISGSVAGWDGKYGDPNNSHVEGNILEHLHVLYSIDSNTFSDLAFAASSILTRDVAGSQFRYAKIITIPFFGAGVVEVPPEGFKRAKNSRKMQMVFFVHEGKVMVEVGAHGMEPNKFTMSKGGCWIVPRGKLPFRVNILLFPRTNSPSLPGEFVAGNRIRFGLAALVDNRLSGINSSAHRACWPSDSRSDAGYRKARR